jgi:hypothetical protein
VLAFGPARTVEAINQSPTPRRKVVDLLARHQPDRSRDQWRGVSARDEHERLVRHRDPQFVLYRHTLRRELDDLVADAVPMPQRLASVTNPHGCRNARMGRINTFHF